MRVGINRTPDHGDDLSQLHCRQSARQAIKKPLFWQHLNKVCFEERWLRLSGFARLHTQDGWERGAIAPERDHQHRGCPVTKISAVREMMTTASFLPPSRSARQICPRFGFTSGFKVEVHASGARVELESHCILRCPSFRGKAVKIRSGRTVEPEAVFCAAKTRNRQIDSSRN